MEFILLVIKFIGAAIVAIIILILLAILIFRIWFNRICKANDHLFNHGEPIINPPRVKLTAYHGKTAHTSMIDRLIHEAEQLGFHLICPNHLFATDLPNDIFVYFLQNNEKTQQIMIYDSENLEKPIIDTMQFYRDKMIRGVSNNPFPSLPYPKNIQTVKLPNETTLTELLKYTSTEFTQDNILSVPEEKLCLLTEQIYAIQQDYLIHLNFADYEYAKAQIEMFNQKNGKTVSREELENNIKTLQKNMKEGYKFNISFVLTNHFLKGTQITAAEWQEYENNIIIVHERETAANLWECYFQDYFIESTYDDPKNVIDEPLIDDALIEKLNDLKDLYQHRPMDYTHAILPFLPKKHTCKKLGEIKYPLNAEFYYLK